MQLAIAHDSKWFNPAGLRYRWTHIKTGQTGTAEFEAIQFPCPAGGNKTCINRRDCLEKINAWNRTQDSVWVYTLED